MPPNSVIAVKDLPLVFSQRLLHRWHLGTDDAPAASMVPVWRVGWVCNVPDQCQKQRVEMELRCGSLPFIHHTAHYNNDWEWYNCPPTVTPFIFWEAHLPNNARVNFWRPTKIMEIAFVFIQKETTGKRVENADSTLSVYFASHLWSRSRETELHYCQQDV